MHLAWETYRYTASILLSFPSKLQTNAEVLLPTLINIQIVHLFTSNILPSSINLSIFFVWALTIFTCAWSAVLSSNKNRWVVLISEKHLDNSCKVPKYFNNYSFKNIHSMILPDRNVSHDLQWYLEPDLWLPNISKMLPIVSERTKSFWPSKRPFLRTEAQSWHIVQKNTYDLCPIYVISIFFESNQIFTLYLISSEANFPAFFKAKVCLSIFFVFLSACFLQNWAIHGISWYNKFQPSTSLIN